MRSSKSRSRNKSNRNRSVGNVVNRVFDSSGPEGKVRGTPQQIIDKYTQLARDAQLGNDRVAFENFQQHGEHYQRMLNEAQREQDARREEHERQNRERQSQSDRDRGQQGGGQRDAQNQGEGGHRQGGDQPEDPGQSPQPDTVEPRGDESSGLVDTPETKGESAPRKPARKPRSRKPSKPKGDNGDNGQDDNGNGDGGDGGASSSGSTEAAE